MSYAHRALELFDSYGDAEAIVHGERRLSYADLAAGVRAMSAAWAGYDAVAILAGNSPEAVMAQLSLHLTGCRSVWIAPNAPSRLSAEYLRLADVDAFAYDPRVCDARLALDLPLIDLTEPVQGGRPEAWSAQPPESLFQTGGTTGTPKLVHHRHDFFDGVAAAAGRHLDAGAARIRQLGIAGFWHSSSQAAAFITLLSGGLLVQHEQFDAGSFLATVQRERITMTTLPPPRLCQVLDHPDLTRTDTSSLVTLSCAGSAIAPARLAEAIAHFGAAVLVAYGMSEATLITAFYPKDQPDKLASCGRAIAPSEVEVRGTPVGEVWAKARLMTSGYWGQPELTEEALVDGWLRTGDLGYLDADGYLFLVDRAKDMIVTGETSTNVYSRTVEDVLCEHPGVRAAAVIGVPHEQMGEAVHAVVQLAAHTTVTEAELRSWAAQRLNELWAPRSVEFVQSLPLTALGKVDKQALRSRPA